MWFRTRRQKFTITLSAAMLTLAVTFSSSVFSGANEQVAKRFGVDEEITILGTSLYIVGFGIGPSIFGHVLASIDCRLVVY